MAADGSIEGIVMPSTLDFARLLPKVELHAHLHGCIRPETLADLARARAITMSAEQLEVLAPGAGRSLSDCFKIFDLIHSVVTDLAAVRRITTEALQDMSQDNVRYAELRTTPRPLPDGTTRETYIKTVLQQLRIFEKENSRATEEDSDEASTVKRALLIPRLLLSVDRSRGVDEAMKVVELALSLKEHDEWGDYILGMDFSGNPTKGLFQDFRPAFDTARRGGLKIAVHCGETLNDADTTAVIDFRPERLGHAIVLGEEVRCRLLSEEPRIPIEICPTSNRLTLAFDNHGEHPTVGCWIENRYPFSVNTDDPGVFDTDLSAEYAHIAGSHGMDKSKMANLACRAVQDIFDTKLLPSLEESFRRECDALLVSVSK